MPTSIDYQAAQDSAVLVDRSSNGKIAVAGADRRSYLHAMLTNDIEPLQPGAGCYAAYLTAQGRMITDMRVLEVGDLILMDLPAPLVQPVMEKLDQFVFSEDVKFGDLTEAFAELTVVGPHAGRVVFDTLSSGGTVPAGVSSAGDLETWPEFRNARVTFHGEMVLLAATRDAGLPGFDLFVERPHAQRLADALAAAGARPVTADVMETLRIEAGRPQFGADLDGETIPLEAGIEGRAISFTKGCYPGQEVVVRVLHRGRGRVARRLVTLKIEGETVPAARTTLRAPADASGGAREIGRITSATWSPRFGGPIALGYVHRDFTEAGRAVEVELEGATTKATVTGLPSAM